MGWPTLHVELDMFNDPLAALSASVGAWNDRAIDVLSFSTKRGRQDELGRVEAGTAQVLFDNTDRLYNPHGITQVPAVLAGIRPMRKVRISATWSGTTYYLFTGYIEGWPPSYDAGAGDATVNLRCVDAFKYFALKKLNGAYASEFTNWSIDTWLTNIAWASADRQLFSGQSQIQSGTFVNTPALTHFRNVESVENGLFFVDGQGRPTFHNRNYRLVNSRSSVATFGDALDGSELPYLDYKSSYDDTYIWNEARITRNGGTEQVASDTASQTAYITRTYTATLPMLSDVEALALAQYFVGRYSQPLFRFTELILSGGMSDSLWPHILGRSIGERITVKSRLQDPQGPSDPFINPFSQDCYIEGIAHSVDGEAGTWTTIFQLSPADQLSFWILQDSVYGVLGSTTRLAY